MEGGPGGIIDKGKGRMAGKVPQQRQESSHLASGDVTLYPKPTAPPISLVQTELKASSVLTQEVCGNCQEAIRTGRVVLQLLYRKDISLHQWRKNLMAATTTRGTHTIYMSRLDLRNGPVLSRSSYFAH
jgi:hypothetical protein